MQVIQVMQVMQVKEVVQVEVQGKELRVVDVEEEGTCV